MNRKEKIKLLKGIREGKLDTSHLNGSQIHFFYKSNDKPGIYEYKGKELTEEEYQSKCADIKKRNNNSIIWNERLTYEDKIITFQLQEGNEPLDPRYNEMDE